MKVPERETMPILPDARRDDAEPGLCRQLGDDRTFGADELDARLLQDILGLDHVVLRDALGDADDQTDTRVRRFDHRGRSHRRRDENERRIRARLGDAIGHSPVDR
jgi:hypothetical protein